MIIFIAFLFILVLKTPTSFRGKMFNLYVFFVISALNFPRRHSISVTSTAHTLLFIWLANEEEFL